ncbi:hypothetical protein DFH09DRAFT_934717, partial [Mycena vulgaris]
MTTPIKTSLDMPLRRSKEAPKTFKGKYSEVDSFLRHYNKLLKKCHVMDPKERCDLILDYCSTKVAEYIKSEEHYTTPNWEKLRAEIRNYFDAEKVDQRYLPADLSAFTRRSARKVFHTLGQWKTYYRKYKAIAGNMGKNKMEDDKIAGYFWLGIHISLRRELNTIIRAQHPNRDTAKAPPMDHVKSAVEEYFKRDHDHSGSSSETTDTENSSDEDDSDREEDKKWKRRLKDKIAQKKKDRDEKSPRKLKKDRKKNEIEVTRDVERTTKFDTGTNEVADIIEKLNTMNIRDPQYGAVYYKAIKMDPLVAQCIHREPHRIQEPAPMGPRQTPPHMEAGPRQAWSVEAAPPSTYPNNITQGERPFNPGCYGCGKTEHRISNCEAILNLSERGVIRR